MHGQNVTKRRFYFISNFYLYATLFLLNSTKVPIFLEKIATLHQQCRNRGIITFSLSFMPMSSSRFKTCLLENLLHPITIDSSSRENYSIYFHLTTRERRYATFLLSMLSSTSANSYISTTLDYLVSTSSRIAIKLDFN